MYKEIQELSQTRRATNDAYAALLELSIYGEAVSIWDKEDLQFIRANGKKPALRYRGLNLLPIHQTNNPK